MRNRCTCSAAWVLVLLTSAPAQGQTVDRLVRPVTTLTDSTWIRDMLDALLIPATGVTHRADVVDITANGFGPDDLILLYPSMEAYLVRDDVPRMLQEAMKSWTIDTDYRVDATHATTPVLNRTAHQLRDARAALSGSILSTIAHYYTGDVMDLRVKQDSSGFRVDVWNFNADSLQYVDQLPSGQQFHFGPPRVVLAFKDPSICVHTYAFGDKVITQSCRP